MRRPFIKEVQSNVKSPHGDWACELGRYTLILGPNRSHKTTIIQALELGASGAVDDIMGRDEVKVASTLMTLKPADADHLFSRVVYSDGQGAEFVASPKGKPTQTWTRPSMVVSRLTRKVMSGSSTKLHEAMIDWMDLQSVSVGEITLHLSNDVHAKYLDIADRMRRGADSEVHILQKIIEYAEKTKREKNAEVKALKALQDFFSDRMTGDLRDNRELADFIFEITLTKTRPLTHMQQVLQYAMDMTLQQCPTCSSPVGQDHLVECHEYMYGQDAGKDGFEDYDFRRILANVETRVLWDLMSETKKKSDTLEAEAAKYKRLKAECSKALDALVAQHASKMCAHANKYLPATWNLKYDEKLKVLGLDRGQNGFHSSLSGAEWATVIAAVACVAADNLPDDTEPVLLVLEDRAWDAGTLAEVMKGLAKFDGQVVIQSTVKPKGRLPAAWTVVQSKEFVKQFNIFEDLTLKEKTKPLTKLQREMLEALGFKEDEVLLMTADTANEIVSQGVAAANVDLEDDGGWSLKEGGNLRVLPKKDA